MDSSVPLGLLVMSRTYQTREGKGLTASSSKTVDAVTTRALSSFARLSVRGTSFGLFSMPGVMREPISWCGDKTVLSTRAGPSWPSRGGWSLSDRKVDSPDSSDEVSIIPETGGSGAPVGHLKCMICLVAKLRSDMQNGVPGAHRDEVVEKVGPKCARFSR